MCFVVLFIAVDLLRSIGCVCEINFRFGLLGLVERPWSVSNARLVLEDGSIWKAKSFGASGTQVGEVVFNTSLTGFVSFLFFAFCFILCLLHC